MKNEERWYKNYCLAKDYYKEHGNLDVPEKYRTKNNVLLGSWVSMQRMFYQDKGKGRLSLEQKSLLKSIGIEESIKKRDSVWLEKYKLAYEYFMEHGNLDISRNYKTSDNFFLGEWVRRQRINYSDNKLSDEQIRLLMEIGMNFEIKSREDIWFDNYKLALEYYEENKNLNISHSYITERGIKLGSWIANQRAAYRGIIANDLTFEQIRLLEEIKMVWFRFKTDDRLQEALITDKNLKQKRYEILHRVYSLLNTYKDEMPSKEEINEDFIRKLNR